MQALAVLVLVGFMGGIAVGIQSPLAAIIGEKLGSLESIFIVHIGGAIASGALLLFVRGGKLSDWHTLPWYALAAGVLGLVVIGAVSFAIPRLGAVATVMLIVAGQFVISMVLDHFGLLGLQLRPLDPQRLLGVAVMFFGVWLAVR